MICIDEKILISLLKSIVEKKKNSKYAKHLNKCIAEIEKNNNNKSRLLLM